MSSMTDYVPATGLYEIAEGIDFVLGGGHDPGTGVCYKNDVFEMHGFWTHDWDCICDYENGDNPDCRMCQGLPGFTHFRTNYRVEWYKRIGRSMEQIGDEKLGYIEYFKMIVECLESVKNDPDPKWGCSLTNG